MPAVTSSIIAATAIIGLGMQGVGTIGAMNAAKDTAQASQAVAGLQTQQNEVRRKAMQLSAKRQKMEFIRQHQRATAMAEAIGVNQGAEKGSGVAGGIAQATGQEGVNTLGVNQNLIFGQNMFTLDNQINQYKMSMAQSASDSATAQGISAMGGNIIKAGAPLGSIFGGGSPAAKSGPAISLTNHQSGIY